MNTFLVALFPFFVYRPGNLQIMQIYPFARIYNVRCLFMRNVVDDTALAQHHQQVVNLLPGQSRTYRQSLLADVGIVCKENRVRSQNHLYQFLRRLTHLAEFIQLIPADREDDS